MSSLQEVKSSKESRGDHRRVAINWGVYIVKRCLAVCLAVNEQWKFSTESRTHK
jgi:hypothetical protein